MCSLLFFLSLLAPACSSKQKEISILWKGEKAIGIQIPEDLLQGLPKDSALLFLSVQLLQASDTTSILGSFSNEQEIEFKPVIPFTRGMHYGVFYQSKKIGWFKISDASAIDTPAILAIFPSKDTLPENLLKVYLQFSHSMREGQSEKYIRLIKNGKDTLTDVFLFLQPELWNANRTVLTLWLNPGRIKKDLQPNLKLGSPLNEKTDYQLFVSKEWTDNQGRFLQKNFMHLFYVSKRDSLSPIAENWQLKLPKPSTKTALEISLLEPLDHFLLLECLHIKNKAGKVVEGIFTTADNDRKINFLPKEAWIETDYILEIESRIEDLAGNNLNRVFDRDLTLPKKGITEKSYRMLFRIE
jgi:hypothetical protein